MRILVAAAEGFHIMGLRERQLKGEKIVLQATPRRVSARVAIGA